MRRILNNDNDGKVGHSHILRCPLPFSPSGQVHEEMGSRQVWRSHSWPDEEESSDTTLRHLDFILGMMGVFVGIWTTEECYKSCVLPGSVGWLKKGIPWMRPAQSQAKLVRKLLQQWGETNAFPFFPNMPQDPRFFPSSYTSYLVHSFPYGCPIFASVLWFLFYSFSSLFTFCSPGNPNDSDCDMSEPFATSSNCWHQKCSEYPT